MDVRLSPTSSADGSREFELQKKKLQENCREFESVMVSFLLKSMRETVMKAEEPEAAREMYEDMFAGQISKEIGKKSAMGLGEILYRKLEPLLKTQHEAALKAAGKVAGDPAAPTVSDGTQTAADSAPEAEIPETAITGATVAEGISLKK